MERLACIKGLFLMKYVINSCQEVVCHMCAGRLAAMQLRC